LSDEVVPLFAMGAGRRARRELPASATAGATVNAASVRRAKSEGRRRFTQDSGCDDRSHVRCAANGDPLHTPCAVQRGNGPKSKPAKQIGAFLPRPPGFADVEFAQHGSRALRA
jgi:hypothetical protein